MSTIERPAGEAPGRPHAADATPRPRRQVVVLGATGSIGDSTLDVVGRHPDRFAVAGVTAVLLTKLDESTALGGLFPWLRACQVPLSYLTTGQNVPLDIEPADRKKFARRLLSQA